MKITVTATVPDSEVEDSGISEETVREEVRASIEELARYGGVSLSSLSVDIDRSTEGAAL